MLASQSVFVVDAHTTGTPIRVVTGGIPPLKGASVAEKMEDMRRNHVWLRTCTSIWPDTATFPWTSGMAATSSCWRTCIPSA